MHNFSLWLFGLAITTAVGCTQQTINIGGREYPAELTEASTIVVANPDFQPTSTTTFHWYMDVIWGAEQNPEAFEDNRLRVRQQIETEFGRKGYRVATGEDTKVGDYVILAAVVVGKPEAVDQIMDLFKLYPDLVAESRHYEEGTLLLGIAKPGVYKASWRGAIRAFTDTTGELPADIQNARLEAAIHHLMKTIPKVK